MSRSERPPAADSQPTAPAPSDRGDPADSLAIELDDPVFVARPYRRYRALRERDPVHFDPRWNMWILTRYEDVRRSFTDRRLTAGHVDMIAGQVEAAGVGADRVATYTALLGNMITFHDRGDHVRIRAMTAGAMTRAAQSWPVLIERAVAELLDRIDPRAPFDAVAALARPLPLAVICDSLGIPAADRDLYHEWAVAYAHLLGVPAAADYSRAALAGEAASVRLRDYFSDLCAERRRRPGDDLISYFVSVFDDAGFGTDGLVSMCVNFANAGHFTVIDQLANAIAVLVRRGDAPRAARPAPNDDLESWRAVVDEAMRFDSNPQFTLRFATEQLELGGRCIPRGAVIGAGLAAANRDPAAFDDPDRFDPDRARGTHLTFGFGPGYCMGSELARQELMRGLRGLFERFPDLAASEREPPVRRWRCLMFRGFDTLPVVAT